MKVIMAEVEGQFLPRVQVHHKDWAVQLPPETARDLARSLIELAEAADQDAFFLKWLLQETGATKHSALNLISEYRGAQYEMIAERKKGDGV